jgi:hypothetical protein
VVRHKRVVRRDQMEDQGPPESYCGAKRCAVAQIPFGAHSLKPAQRPIRRAGRFAMDGYVQPGASKPYATLGAGVDVAA